MPELEKTEPEKTEPVKSRMLITSQTPRSHQVCGVLQFGQLLRQIRFEQVRPLLKRLFRHAPQAFSKPVSSQHQAGFNHL